MSNFTKPVLLPPFGPAATQSAVDASTEAFPSEYIINIILEISNYLVALVDHSALFGRPNTDPYSPSLHTLHSRLHSGHLNPSPLQTHANEQARIKAALSQRTAKDAAHRPLEDFEDLYYAVLARMQDMHQILNARLGSGFNTTTDTLYADGPTIAALHDSLSQYWDVLNHTAFVRAIDAAVRRSRVKSLHQEILAQVHNDEITQADADELLTDLYDPAEYDGIQGLAWVSGWAPSMVAAWLEEKYRSMLGFEREEVEKKGRMDRKRARMGQKGKKPQQERTSKKEGQKMVEDMQMDGGAVEMATGGLRPQEHIKDHGNQHDQQHDALEWQLKTQRVEEYSQYLRGMASRDARYVVQSTVFNNAQALSGAAASSGYQNSEMTGLEF